MKIAIDLVKNILLPEIEKDLKFDIQKLNADFWEKFRTDLLNLEVDAKPLYASIYSLELADAEKIIDKLWVLYSKLIEELAESYALGQPSEEVDYLLKTDNEIFLKKIGFLKTMQQAIKSVERKNIKADLPNSYKRLTFELSDTDLANASRRKGRIDLKEKMKKWDKELIEESTELVTANYSQPKLSYNLDPVTIPKSNSKVISLSWMKYATIAAIFIIGFMVWQPNKLSNDELFAQYNSEESIHSIEYNKMEIISESGGVRGGEVLFQNYTKSETDEAMKAIELFKNNNYENAKKILTDLNPRDKNNNILFFLAIAQLKTNQVEQAVTNLEYLNTISNYEFANEVKFHLALGYINQSKKKKSKDLLLALVATDNKYSKASQDILDNMRWF